MEKQTRQIKQKISANVGMQTIMKWTLLELKIVIYVIKYWQGL